MFAQSATDLGAVKSAQSVPPRSGDKGAIKLEVTEASPITETTLSSSVTSAYRDPVQGASSSDLGRRALASNGELKAVRLDLERGRARLLQAGLRPNPTIDFEQSSEKLTGSGTDRATMIGFALPLELGGKRSKRVELARVELEAAEAEVADRERLLIGQVANVYAEALAAIRELEITEGLNNLDVQTVRMVEVRVNEGDSAPIELRLLQVEVERLRARRAIVEGRLQATLLRLKQLVGMASTEALRLREDITAPVLNAPPATVEAALDIALRTRPDLRLARLYETAAQAGLDLAQAQAVPNATLFTRYFFDRTTTDLPLPLVPVPNQSRRLIFGVSIGLPFFNRNQGGKAEAAAAIAQAQRRREFAETVVRAEVSSAYTRYEAARIALHTFEQGVIARTNENLRSIRGAYEIGAFRITDLLLAQRRLIDLQREFTEALTERYRALIDLQMAMGTAALSLEPRKSQ
ncbi:MAG: TolC family protein [Acidobacteria bacterium]|nr:TolC family protein [Acidobacteriota bacterium]